MAKEKKEGETDEQFIYKTRKKGLGPFKEKFWNLPAGTREKIGKELEERFDLLLNKLKVKDTYNFVAKYTSGTNVPIRLEDDINGVNSEGKKAAAPKAGDRGE